MKKVNASKLWRSKLQKNYRNFDEWERYSELYGLAKRLGFDSAKSAWDANPTIQGSTDPADFSVVKPQTKTPKRILSVTIRRIVDESPDTSWLGEYSNRPTSEFSIDRAHSEDCASVRADIREAKNTLEHVQQTLGDMQEAYRNANLDREFIHDPEWDALEDAYNEIGELVDSIDECDCGEHGDMERNEYRYFNPSFNYVDKSGHALPDNTPEEVRKYVRQDYDRMESLNRGNICFIGIRAEAECLIPCNLDRTPRERAQTCSFITQRITSGGLWGIESDSDDSYLESAEKDELADLRTQLKALGFSSRAISSAFKSVERKDS